MGDRAHDPEHPPFEAQYAVRKTLPNSPSIDEISTTAETGPALRNGWIIIREIIAATGRLTLSAESHSSSSTKSTGIAPDTPAAWTKPPSDPRASATPGTAASMADVSATSTTDHAATAP
jgi:hypothetical protein